jgi:hypothetical protein
LSIIPFEKCPLAVQNILNNWDWCPLLIYTSSFLNPVIYGLSNQQFRTAFKNIIRQGREVHLPGQDDHGLNVVQRVAIITTD